MMTMAEIEIYSENFSVFMFEVWFWFTYFGAKNSVHFGWYWVIEKFSEVCLVVFYFRFCNKFFVRRLIREREFR